MYIFNQAKNAILFFDSYSDLIKTKFSKSIFYALFFIIISNILYFAEPFLSSYIALGNFESFVENYIPDFEVKNGQIVIDDYYISEVSSDFIIVFEPDIENIYITSEEVESSENIILKFTPTHFISNIINIPTAIYPIITIFNIQSNSDLVNLKPFLILALVISFFILLINYMIYDIVLLILFVIFINLIFNFYGLKFSLKEFFNLSVYVNTMPYILKTVLSMFNIFMPNIIYLGVVLSYLYFILKIFLANKSDLKKLQHKQI